MKRYLEPAVGEDGKAESKKQKRECKEFQPRSYQLAVFEVALQRNTIAMLGTGAGKTLIAVMLLKHMAQQTALTSSRKHMIFLAPTVHLVEQQCEVIKNHTELEVEHLHGSKGVDGWTAAIWKEQLSRYQVMVMTPQILLDALCKAYLTMDIFCLIIFDECHRATGNHPYSRIMTEFYHTSAYKPKVFGMTASPLTRKGVSSSTDCENQLSELETLLDSKIYTFPDRAEMEQYVPYAREINRYYDPNIVDFEELKKTLELIHLKYDSLLGRKQQNYATGSDHESLIDVSRKKLSKCLLKICHCLNDLGFICAKEATEHCLESVRLPSGTDAFDIALENASIHRKFFSEVLQLIDENLLPDCEECLKSEDGITEAAKLGYISPKLCELINIFHSFSEHGQVRCLVFVERKIVARVIMQLMKKISFFENFSCAHLTGGSSSVDALTPKMQKETLDSFRSGKVNILLTTDVAEEGLDVPKCSCVIRFDLPQTIRSYVQSRGRARQMGSEYILMLERNNMQKRNLVLDLLRSENAMVDSALLREYTMSSNISEHGENEFAIKQTGAKVNTDTSVSLIYQYCDKLPRDRNRALKPDFKFKKLGAFFECTLTLPANAALQNVVSGHAQTCQKAKQLACLEACKMLHQCGALDNHLRPSGKEAIVQGCSINVDKSSSHVKYRRPKDGEGTTKRKELHSVCEIRDLGGNWLHEIDVRLQGYKIDFVCDVVGQNFANFVLLIDAKLDYDVASWETDLYLRGKTVRASISPCGVIMLNRQQMNEAKLFQELLFNGLFAKLFTGSKSSGSPRKFLLKEDDTSLWSHSKMYFLLPLILSRNASDSVFINWEAVGAAARAAKFMITDRSQKKEAKMNEDVIYLADGPEKRQNIENMVVLAIHTGKIYIVLKVANGLSSESTFDGASENTKFQTYTDYFRMKYKIALQHPNQPLLLLKHSHNPHNLLSSGGEDGITYVAKPQNHAHMPPELLLPVDIPIDVLKSFYLFPSLMYRLESLMLASQLRREIAYDFGGSSIPISLILEALTTVRSCEDFCLERLELLGDSVLKYAVSCYLYLKHPDKHEGQLSSARTRIICNATLHKLGIKCNIQGYIRDAAFEPRRWLAPGQISIHHCPCNCPLKDGSTHDVSVIDDKSIFIGKVCDRGHRWICSKTISDCVEALIGAYYLGGGLPAAVAFLRWLGIEVGVDEDDVARAVTKASLQSYAARSDVINLLEAKLGYTFAVKGLLLEAITHQSYKKADGKYSYERLEFLGDAVLDILITQYLYKKYDDIDPGELTDLRSASVNNETFAQAAVRHKFHEHLQHSSAYLFQQITEYVGGTDETVAPSDAPPKGPKVLGDIVESITGAVLIDSKLDLGTVWNVLEPLLSPIVTPESLELPPLRHLIEWCSQNGYFVKPYFENKPDMVVVTLQLQLKEVLLVRRASNKLRKDAKAQAAAGLLKDLEKLGLLQKSGISADVGNLSKENANIESLAEDTKITDFLLVEPAHVPVKRVKGGPRMALYELCKRYQWPMPVFDCEQTEPRDAPCYDAAGNVALQCYFSNILIHIPDAGSIELAGEARADKKAAQDSAALQMLYEIQRRGGCSITEV